MACRTLPIRYVVVSLPATTSVTRTARPARRSAASSSARRSAEIRSSASSTSAASHQRRAVCSRPFAECPNHLGVAGHSLLRRHRRGEHECVPILETDVIPFGQAQQPDHRHRWAPRPQHSMTSRSPSPVRASKSARRGHQIPASPRGDAPPVKRLGSPVCAPRAPGGSVLTSIRLGADDASWIGVTRGERLAVAGGGENLVGQCPGRNRSSAPAPCRSCIRRRALPQVLEERVRVGDPPGVVSCCNADIVVKVMPPALCRGPGRSISPRSPSGRPLHRDADTVRRSTHCDPCQ